MNVALNPPSWILREIYYATKPCVCFLHARNKSLLNMRNEKQTKLSSRCHHNMTNLIKTLRNACVAVI